MSAGEALAGGVVGNLLTVGAIRWVSKIPFFFVQGMTVPPAALGINLGAALVIGLASSVVPAWNAARLPIPEALRHSG